MINTAYLIPAFLFRFLFSTRNYAIPSRGLIEVIPDLILMHQITEITCPRHADDFVILMNHTNYNLLSAVFYIGITPVEISYLIERYQFCLGNKTRVFTFPR